MKYIISLGGSLFAPKSGFDDKFIKKFRDLILVRVQKGDRFIIVCGGGQIARDYQEVVKKIFLPQTKEKDRGDVCDWLGISVTKTNALLLKIALGDSASLSLNVDPLVRIKQTKPVVVMAGFKPGCSTDRIAVAAAKANDGDKVINLSNIDFVYDSDPKLNKNAQKKTVISWQEFCDMIGNKWQPGANLPFDPIASRLAAKEKITVIIANGHKLNNLEKIFNGQKFIGTIIS